MDILAGLPAFPWEAISHIVLLSTTESSIGSQQCSQILLEVTKLNDHAKKVYHCGEVGKIWLASVELWRLTNLSHSGFRSQSFELPLNVMTTTRPTPEDQRIVQGSDISDLNIKTPTQG